MRKKIHQQLPIAPAWIDQEHARELWKISAVLDELPELQRILELIEADVLRGSRSDTGRVGLTADQVLRVLIVKQMRGFSYEQLAFALADSSTYGAFCRLGIGSKPRKKTALNSNIKLLRPTTLEAVNRVILKLAKAEEIEDGEKVRGDCTTVQTNIHRPTDSSSQRFLCQAMTVSGFTNTSASRHPAHLLASQAHKILSVGVSRGRRGFRS